MQGPLPGCFTAAGPTAAFARLRTIRAEHLSPAGSLSLSRYACKRNFHRALSPTFLSDLFGFHLSPTASRFRSSTSSYDVSVCRRDRWCVPCPRLCTCLSRVRRLLTVGRIRKSSMRRSGFIASRDGSLWRCHAYGDVEALCLLVIS